MKLGASSVVLAAVVAGPLAARVLAGFYRRMQFFRVIGMVDPPVWVLYPAIVLHIAPANRRRTEVRSADGLVTSMLL
ncbi:MAG TPA: hypothetical protein VE400_00275 [Mycobacterium sp.]|jgi:hypothetical protein|nr:hypothetical protein [Mycobacterium sp.]